MDWENRTEVILPAGCGLGALSQFGVPWPVRPTGNGVFTGIRWGIVSRFCTETKSVVEICPAGPCSKQLTHKPQALVLYGFVRFFSGPVFK